MPCGNISIYPLRSLRNHLCWEMDDPVNVLCHQARTSSNRVDSYAFPRYIQFDKNHHAKHPFIALPFRSHHSMIPKRTCLLLPHRAPYAQLYKGVFRQRPCLACGLEADLACSPRIPKESNFVCLLQSWCQRNRDYHLALYLETVALAMDHPHFLYLLNPLFHYPWCAFGSSTGC
ncbi:hypothetical protein GQ44DRAFT_492342 [Phaeosphaeriaceae sp. PMI808]|nr:hypothetical protein GQ44DRAFT_492342 [Phaeosphaeriaceae sp. PMI808]